MQNKRTTAQKTAHTQHSDLHQLDNLLVRNEPNKKASHACDRVARDSDRAIAFDTILHIYV